MSKKNRRRTQRTTPKPTKLSPEAIEGKARQDLAAGRYRDAISGFKQVLKMEQRPDWRSALADAYAGRARELTAKGMLKEALAIWENRASLGACAVFDPEHVELLLRLGQIEPVLALFGNDSAAPPDERNRLRPLLAARCLSGDEMIQERLPADDPVVLHAAAARSALAAYCAGDDTALQRALAAIPFRSPYRDWVHVVKALQRLPERPAEAADLLARIGDDSAFGRLKRAAELCLLPDGDFAAAIAGAGKSTRRFACALRGWPQERVALWEELERLGANPRPETLLRFMYRHREALGEHWIRRCALRLLTRGFPASLKWLASVGAGPATREESNLVAAWYAEEGGDLWDEQERWEIYARHLMHGPAGEDKDPDHKLRIALALRRCDRLGNVLAKADPSDDPEDLDRLVAEQVEKSLTWDPDDRDTYLRLIGYYRRGKQLKDVRRLLDRAAVRWPKDMQILGAALDTALDAGSFKKASALAREMLTLDPINTGVRERLVEAHLAHARKQTAKGRSDLARKEIENAKEWARSANARDQLELTSGLIALLDDGATGGPILRGLIGRLGGGVAALVALALAGDALKLPPQELMKKIGLQPPSTPTRDDLLAALARLRTHADGGGRISRNLGAYLSKALTNAPWASLSRGETEMACDTLRRCQLHQVRLRAARAALKRWRGEPLFELHAFEAKYPSGYDGRSDNDIFRLETALERAREQGDMRTVVRIKDILADQAPFGIGPTFLAPPAAGPGPFEPSGGDAVAMLIETLGLDRALDMLGLPASMKREIKDMERRLGTEAVMETLTSMFDLLEGIATGDIKPPVPQPPPRRSNGPKGGKQGRRGADNADCDDPFPDQLDLF